MRSEPPSFLWKKPLKNGKDGAPYVEAEFLNSELCHSRMTIQELPLIKIQEDVMTPPSFPQRKYTLL